MIGARRVAALLGVPLLALAGGAWMLGLRPYLERRDIWSIALYEGDGPFAVRARGGVDRAVLTAADVTDRSAVFVADPFLLRRDGVWHLFFEVLARVPGGEDGVIALATSADGRRFEYRGVVLDEPFHLSYPYVFEWDGRQYMIPESAQANAVRLYRAVEFPRRWELVTTLLRSLRPGDPSLFHFQGRFWLFVESSLQRHDTLRLFSSDQLTGPYLEHPQSPVATGARVSRPGGRVLEADGRQFRIAQDCEPAYGSAVRVFEILELTPTAYRERELPGSPVLGPSRSGWNSDGMHTLDPHPLAGQRWLAAVDGQRLEWRGGVRWR